MLQKDLDIVLKFLDGIFDFNKEQRQLLVDRISSLSDDNAKELLELFCSYSEKRSQSMKSMLQEVYMKSISIEEEMDKQGLI